MKNLFSITSRDFSLNDGIKQEIRSKASELDRWFDRITGCDVIVEGPGRQRRIDAFGIHIRVSVPGEELVVSHQSSMELREAIDEAFDATGRCLKSYARVMQGRSTPNS